MIKCTMSDIGGDIVANIKSAKKRIRVTERKTVVNKKRVSAIKTYIKNFDIALENEDFDKAQELLKAIDKKLKKAAINNTVHRNTARRKVSKLHKKLNLKMNEAV